MTVPVGRRSENRLAFVIETRTAYNLLSAMLRRLPKSQAVTRWQWVAKDVNDAYVAVETAESIYMTTADEGRERLGYLFRALGLMRALSGMADDWYAHPPLDAAGRPCLDGNAVMEYSKACSRAIMAIKGTIRYTRTKVRELEGMPSIPTPSSDTIPSGG